MTQPAQPAMQLHGQLHIIAGMTDKDPCHSNPRCPRPDIQYNTGMFGRMCLGRHTMIMDGSASTRQVVAPGSPSPPTRVDPRQTGVSGTRPPATAGTCSFL